MTLNKVKGLTFAAVVLTLTAWAPAQITVSVAEDTVNPPIDSNFTAYIVTFNAPTPGDANTWLTAFDGNFTGDLQQVWKNDGGVVKTYDAQSYTADGGVYRNDTHFLPDTLEDEFIEADEDKDPATAGAGVGTFIDGLFGVAPSSQAASIDLARIVVVPGTEVLLNGIAADKAGTGTYFTDYVILEASSFLTGDVNGDGLVNADDINAFVDALTLGEAGFNTNWPNGEYEAADVNDDTLINADDINPFVALLTGGGTVPEPATLVLLGMGGLAVIRRRRNK